MHPQRSQASSRSSRAPRRAFVAALMVAIASAGLLAGFRAASADEAAGAGPLTVADSGHWFEYSGNGTPYFMAGSGGPEGFLYYSDARRQDIVDQLIENDVRAIYIHAVRSNGGDGSSDQNPFVNNTPSAGVDSAVLDEWDSYLSQLDQAGIVTWFHLYDDGARPFGACNPDLPAAEKDFVKTVVERFRDYQHLVWLPTEEHIIKACSNNSVDIEKAEALAAEIRIHDPVHPLGVHHNNGQSNQYLGNDDIDVFAQQVCQQSRFTSVDGIHDAGEFGEDVYVMAECHPWHKELLAAGQRTTLRQSFWSSVMAGGYVLFYDAWESNDPTAGMLADLGRVNAFMDTTRFAETAPADQLAASGTKWVLANESEDVYIAYANTNPPSMGVQGLSAGTYDLGWFDPVTGVRVDQAVSVGGGTETFAVPAQIGAEVALSIEPADGTPPTPTPTTEPTAPPSPTPTTPTPTAPPSPTPTVPPSPTPTPPSGPVVDLVATDDVYLQGATAFDTDQLRVEAGSRTRTSYIRFDTSGITAADGVRFRLTVGSDPGDGTLQIALGEGGAWSESTLTPANAPTAATLLGSVDGPFVAGQQIELVLPADTIAGSSLDLVLTTDGADSDDVSFESTEAGDGPTLRIDTQLSPPTPTATPTATATPPIEPPATVELGAVEDAYLQGTKAFDNTQLRVEQGSRIRISYVRFDTTAVDNAGRVRLELVVGSDAGSGTIAVWQGIGGDWTSATLTPGNAPEPAEELASASGSFATGQRVALDLPVGAVDGNALDLVITHSGSGADDLSFGASEGGNGPRLIVETTASTPPTPTPPSPPTPTPPAQGPDNETVTFTGVDTAIANPERGFHKGVSVADSTNGGTTSVSQMSAMYADGIRVARMYVRLDDYRNGPIPQSQLAALAEVFSSSRAAGIKLIPRFSYNFGSAPDASVERIEQHIEQLTPTLEANADVIAALQAGFIGAWGEWHSSTNGLTNPEDRARVKNALLRALPTDRMIQFRYPDDIIEFEPTALTSANAWSGSDASRTGHKNDCFLANEHDAGTYLPLSRKSEFVAYLAAITEFTVMGGETCQVSLNEQRTDCPTALAELEKFHWDYLNLDFYGDTIDRWRVDGCFEEIETRLGHRYEMQSAVASTQAALGEAVTLTVSLANDGFGKLYNPRPINVVLVNGDTGAVRRIERVADARSVLPRPGATVTVDLGFEVPADLASGTYRIQLELPDGSASLAGDPRYSIRMANVATWRPAEGTNDLGLTLTVGS